MFKKLLILLFILLSVFFLSTIFMYTNPNSLITVTIEKWIPDNIKKVVVKTIFSYPNLKKEVVILQNKIDDNEKKLNELKLKFNNFVFDNSISSTINSEKKIIELSQNLKINKFEIPFYSHDLNEKPVAYIDIYKDKLIIISGNGKILSLQLEDIKKNNIIFSILNSNIKDIIKNELFYDIRNINKSSYQVSVKDILIHKNKLYLSYTKLISDNCYNTSILSANINFELLLFSDFFTYDECILTTSKDLENFYVLVSGGRMIINQNDKMLFTIGDYRNSDIAQIDNSFFGKILEIDLETGNSEIFSKSHRNPQGLLFDKKFDIVLSTEHGPKGGDEVNIINKGENYGWPISSYGDPYSGKTSQKMPYLKSHLDFGFKEPIFTFSNYRDDGIKIIGEKNIAIGISQLVKINKESKFNQFGDYIVSSMKDKSLYFFKFNKYFEETIKGNKIKINERIRDIIYDQSSDTYLMILENTPSLAILN